MTSVRVGQRAEQVAADFLVYKGCLIVARNWRTRVCEIDIIASRGCELYFCEVKYRANTNQGTGLDYITPTKLRRMQFAAQVWLAQNNWQGDCQLCAIEVSGPHFRITNVVKNVL